MEFDGGLFMDLENLVKGYAWDSATGRTKLARAASSMSLTSLNESISEQIEFAPDGYAVRRAYLNWSAEGSAAWRSEVTDLGIEPRQVFGLGRTSTKNLADIELVIDVLELAYTNPRIKTFVLMTGDGSFSPLVRFLHRFGRTVVAASFPGDAARALISVADQYIEIPYPWADEEPARRSTVRPTKAPPPQPLARPAQVLPVPSGVPALIANALGAAPGQPAGDREAAVAVIATVLTRLAADGPARERMGDTGIGMASLVAVLKAHGFLDSGMQQVVQIVKEAVSAGISDLEVVNPALGDIRLIVAEANERIMSDTAPVMAMRPAPPKAAAEPREWTDPLRLTDKMQTLVQEALEGRESPLAIDRVAAMLTPAQVEVVKACYGSVARGARAALAGSDFCVARTTNDPTRPVVMARAAALADEHMEVAQDVERPTEEQTARAALKHHGFEFVSAPKLHAILLGVATAPADVVRDIDALLERLAITLPEVTTDPLRRTLYQIESLGAIPADLEGLEFSLTALRHHVEGQLAELGLNTGLAAAIVPDLPEPEEPASAEPLEVAPTDS